MQQKSKYIARFATVAGERFKTAFESLQLEGGAETIKREMHTLAGEAAVLGLKEVAAAAREAEAAAKAWAASGETQAQATCAKALRTVGRQLRKRGSANVDTRPPPSAEAPAGGILVVDDSAVVAGHICAALEALGENARAAHGHVEALSLIRRGGIDRVLVDLQMPTPVETVAFIADVAALSPAPVIVVMSGVEPSELDRLLADGGQGEIPRVSKLSGVDSLVEAIRRVRR